MAAFFKQIFTGIIFFFCGSFLPCANAQEAGNGVAYIDSLIHTTIGLMNSDAAAARKNVKLIDELSSRQNYQHGKAEALFFRAWFKYRQEDAGSCIKFIDSTRNAKPWLSEDATIVKFLILKGQCYVKQSQFGEAIKNFIQALDVAKANGDDETRTGALVSIGWAYMEDAKPAEAIDFFREVLRLNPQKDYRSRGVVLCNIAACYNMQGDYVKAAAYAAQGIETAKAAGNFTDLANGLNILARSEYKRHRYQEAILHLKAAGRAREKVADPAMLASDYLELAEIYQELNEPEQAVLYAKKAEAISYVNKVNLKLSAAYVTLANSFTKMGDYKNAVSYYDKLVKLKDSSSAGNYQKALAELQVRYATEKKNAENLTLKKENLESRLGNSRKKIWMSILGGILLLVVITGTYFYYLTRSRHRTNLALTQLKEQKNTMLAVMKTEEQERKRIAEGLHDGVNQTIAAAALQLKNAAEDPRHVEKAAKLIDQAADEVRSVSHQVTPELLVHYGLAMAIRQSVNRLNDTGAKTKFYFYNDTSIDELPEMLSIVVYRSFQELTNNIIKHANASEAHIHLDMHDDEIVLMAEDNGVGFDKNAINMSLGFRNLESRIRFFEGSLAIDATPGKGTSIILKFPVNHI